MNLADKKISRACRSENFCGELGLKYGYNPHFIGILIGGELMKIGGEIMKISGELMKIGGEIMKISGETVKISRE